MSSGLFTDFMKRWGCDISSSDVTKTYYVEHALYVLFEEFSYEVGKAFDSVYSHISESDISCVENIMHEFQKSFRQGDVIESNGGKMNMAIWLLMHNSLPMMADVIEEMLYDGTKNRTRHESGGLAEVGDTLEIIGDSVGHGFHISDYVIVDDIHYTQGCWECTNAHMHTRLVSFEDAKIVKRGKNEIL